ncbi:DNA polymerase/3'-5' exonuclease PolX [Salinirussus salinus]|jgi:DNA polymerase (family 10)|uniref:DNA polymerase/3'-5' exonuclease PolX n=1 Tax=Salinirussus salinus TaxID=1198300 RepID=UPI00135923AF|nr:DNA polymerase/3'-5' exonuclease PolX [Salinirussus salinus]
MSRNDEVARRLEEFADRLEATGVEYKPRSYRNAAENVRDHPAAIEDLAREGPDAVAGIEGVGDAISAKVVEYIETGEIGELEELREQLPVDIDALTSVEGVGPKTAGQLYEALGVEDLDDLEAAAEAGEIREVSGFGEKTEQNILEGIPFARQAHGRHLLGEGRPQGERVLAALETHEAVTDCDLAGSLRRWKPTVGDVDVLAASDEPAAAVEAFTSLEAVDTVIEAGDQKASARIEGIQVDLRAVVPEEFGSALQYFTGSRDHNVALRNRAIDRELKVNEYGVFDVSDVAEGNADHGGDGQRAGERVAGDTERSMYDAVDLPWIPPELREGRGEIEAAAAGDLPDLVTVEGMRGDLHVHTDWSDGRATLAEMVAGAGAAGHDYVAVTDHATGPGMVGGVGLDDDRLREQLPAVREAGDDADVDVFAGVEANIGSDGTVSVGDDLLADLDLVVASPHAALEGDGTDRLVAACEHPAVDVVGHPTGRRLNERAGMDVDVDRLAAVAAETGTALEVNANPHRLDLGGSMVRAAVDAGATVAVNTDAHHPDEYGYLRYGVHTARRGWAEADQVLNARDADGVRDFLG